MLSLVWLEGPCDLCIAPWFWIMQWCMVATQSYDCGNELKRNSIGSFVQDDESFNLAKMSHLLTYLNLVWCMRVNAPDAKRRKYDRSSKNCCCECASYWIKEAAICIHSPPIIYQLWQFMFWRWYLVSVHQRTNSNCANRISPSPSSKLQFVRLSLSAKSQ